MATSKKKKYEDEFGAEDEEQIVPERSDQQPLSKSANPFILEELGQIAPAVPIRWAQVHPSDWPYESPEDEFIRSPFPLDMITLAQRWEGLWKSFDIERYYSERDWDKKRFEYLDEKLKKGYEKSLADDAEYQARIIDQDLRHINEQIERLRADLMQGVEYRPIRNAGAFGYVKMPMTVDSKNKINHQIGELMKLRRTTFGLATEIKKNEHTLSLADEMAKSRAQTDPGYAEMLKIAGLDKDIILPSMAPDMLEEGKEIWDVTERALAGGIDEHMLIDRTKNGIDQS